MPNYRVVKITTDDFKDGKKTEKVIWQGTGVSVLNAKHRRSEVFGADDLKHHEIEDGWIRFGFRFERQSDGGEWVECDDPRPKSAFMTALEREIDSENRRLYPGDYENDYDYDDYDDDYDDRYDDYEM